MKFPKTGYVPVFLILAACAKSGAQLWVNHDMEQHAKIPKAPQSVQ